MKMLYHPKRILGFEPYVAPEGFDRKAQPVDIYDVFERYYKNHRTAKWIFSVSDSFTPHSYYNFALNANELTLPVYEGQKSGASFIISSEIGGIRTKSEIPVTHYTGTLTNGTYNSIEVESTEGYPSSGKITLGNYTLYSGTRKAIFQYDSKDSTHFYWSGSAQTLKNINASGKIVMPVAIFGSSTKRYIIGKNIDSNFQPFSYASDGYPSPIYGAEWLYCGDKISSIATSSANGGVTTIKYIHVHKLDNITTYGYGTHRDAPLVGTLHISACATDIGVGGTGLVFSGCTGITGTLNIPGNIKNIYSQSCFNGCTGLTEIKLNEGLENIGNYSFNGCTGLDGTLAIPNSCTTIGNNAFSGCNKLDTLNLGKGVQTIGISAFQSCSQLSGTLTLPDSLTTIGTLAFYGCTSFFGTLTIPANITSIGQGAFGDDNFSDIDVTANSRYEDVDDVLYEISTRTALHSIKSDTGTITFQTNTLIIGDYCCLRNQRTGTLTVPDSVTRVGIYAFYDCDGFTALDLETTTSGLVTIDDYAFAHQSNLAGTITIPDSVTLIDANAFRDLPKVTALSFGTGLITIGANAFSAMIGLAGNIVIPNSVETIGASAFAGDTALIGTLTLGTGLKTIGGTAFGNVPFTGTLTIPSAVTTIGEGAFYNNNFTAIASSASGFTVSDYVLYDETVSGQIKAHTSARGYSGTLTFKAGTTSILYLCLYNNDNRTGAIVIPYTVTAIGREAFRNCSGFNNTVTIGDTTNGSSLTTIGRYAFIESPNITGWNIYRTPAPTCNQSFSNYAKPLHVKSGATGYDVTPATNAAPWTNTAIFSSVTYDL